MGPYSTVDTESLHLSQILVGLGATVTRGQLIAISGASGNGSESGYAAHLHVSGLFNGTNLDIQPYLTEVFPPITPPTPDDEDPDMTDLIYYADQTLGPRFVAGAVSVEVESMWYQECLGAPLYPLTGNAAYTSTAASLEYQAFAATRTAVTAKRFAASAAAIGSLIQLRGTTTKPTGNF